MHEYDLIAEWYAGDRGHQAGVPEAEALAASLRRGALVLDAGCGNGIPLTRALVAAGCRVFGVDSSSAMLERFRKNLPDVPAVCAQIETVDFGGRTFDGAIAWGIIFHLTLDRQRQAIANIAGALEPGAPFLFTSGDAAGDDPAGITGQMNGVTFHYYSYGAESYRRLLAEFGCTLEHTHRDAGENMYYLARKHA
ncbi:MAG TPA: class I SAM-dependent methyltransferase [Vicinamibacterales bacterium]|nr:class I SAM-dependent methyltransferase [Vicinamibacterales bacterium]